VDPTPCLIGFLLNYNPESNKLNPTFVAWMMYYIMENNEVFWGICAAKSIRKGEKKRGIRCRTFV
jgi:hypothetical protein